MSSFTPSLMCSVVTGHVDMPGLLNNLGHSFRSRFKSTGDISDLYTATSTCRKSATIFGPPSTRLRTVLQWVQLSKISGLSQTLTAYGVVLDLIATIAGFDHTIQHHADLIEISSLTTSAVSAAFTMGNGEKALEWLEQGRYFVWNQLNQLRTPPDHLHAHDKHLAQLFLNISGALEASGSRHGSEGLGQGSLLSQKINLQDEAHLHIKPSHERSEPLDEIRRIPQMHDFFRPPQASYLLKHLPLDGIVILFNVHEDRCDALALISGVGAPLHIPLDFTYDEASDLRERLCHFLSYSFGGVRTREVHRATRPAPRPDSKSEIYFILEALWIHVVRPILEALAYSVSVSQFME